MSSQNRQIKLATLFSGIGAIEQAFVQMRLPHKLIFACDNGENELTPLPTNLADEYKDLCKREKTLKAIEIRRLSQFKKAIDYKFAILRQQIDNLPDNNSRHSFVQELYKKYLCDKENLVKRSYLANYELSHDNFHSDIRLFNGTEYQSKVDILVGGSPCQSFSSNGKRAGISDTRGTLFNDYARVIRNVNPRCFIFENVKGMLVHDNGLTWKIVKEAFNSLNYIIHIKHDKNGAEQPLLNAVDYGIPQNRERLFIIGIRKDLTLKRPFRFPDPIQLTSQVSDYLERDIPAKYYLGKKGFEFVTSHPSRAQVGQNIMNCQKANQQFNWNGDFIFEDLTTIKSEEILQKAFVGNWKGRQGVIRKFTPRECLRLMGFSDSFKIVVNDNVMYRQCGNSIAVDVLRHIMDSLISTGIFQHD